MDEINVFAQRLKETRIKAGLSQAELSRQTGIAPATLSSYEVTDSSKKPTMEKVILIAKALNVSLDWLCGIEKYKDDFSTYSNEQFYRSLAYVLSSTDVVMQEDCVKLFGEKIDFARQANELYNAKLEKRLNDEMLNLCISCLVETYQKPPQFNPQRVFDGVDDKLLG